MKELSEKGSPLLISANEISTEAIRAQLARILISKGFAGSERLGSLLEFIVDRSLKGDAASLKETVIGTQVFNKPVGYDTQNTSIVRTTVQRLRTELTKYYKDWPDDPIIISLPKGHYRPQFAMRPTIESERINPPTEIASLPPSRWSLKNWVIIYCFLAVIGVLSVFLYLDLRASSNTNSRQYPAIGRLFARATSEGKAPTRLDIGHEIGSLVVAPDGRTLYAVERLGQTVTVLGAEDLKIKARLHLPHPARGAVISKNGKHVYVGSPDDAVMVVDTVRGIVERVLPTGGAVFDLAVTRDEKKLFLAMGNAGLKRLLTASPGVSTLSEFACPLFLNMDPEGSRLFVGYQCGGPGGRRGHDVLEIYDTSSEQRLGVIHDLPMVGGEPIVSPRGDMLLLDAADACVTKTYDHIGCPEISGHVFHLIRLADRTLVKSFVRPKDMYGAAFSPDGSRLVFGGESLTVMDWAKQTITEVAPIPNGSFSRIVFTPSGNQVFAASAEGGTEILAFDTERQCSPAPAGLAHVYSGDGTLDDSIGVSPLTAVGLVKFAPGLIGQAFQFGSGNDPLKADAAAACPECYGVWTESFFAKFNSTDGEMTLLEREGRSDRWRHRIFKASDNRIVLEVGAPARPLISGSTPALPNRWYHVALVADNTRRSLFIDGVLQGEMDFGKWRDSPHTSRGMVFFGADRENRAPLNGLIDEITWYERALNKDEVMNLARSASPSTCRP